MAAWKSELGKGGSGGDNSQTPPTAKVKHNRSRGGCTRCRKRRQKCDEEKPKCKRCEADGEKECVYEVNIQWGGRNFQHYARNENIKKHGTFLAPSLPNSSFADLVNRNRTRKLCLCCFLSSKAFLVSESKSQKFTYSSHLARTFYLPTRNNKTNGAPLTPSLRS
jgi:hypothetical protein